MADDDFDDDPSNQSEDMKLDSTILKLAGQRASIDRKRKDLNEEARQINATVDKLGIVPAAFMLGVRLVKGMDKGEQRDFLSGVRRTTRVVGERQAELWPEEAKRVQDRIQRAKDKKAKQPRSGDELDAKTNSNPRSDPKKGGAGKKNKPEKPEKSAPATATSEAAKTSDALVKAAIAKQSGGGAGAAPGAMKSVEDAEQAEGAETLAAMAPQTEAAKLSQSEIARQKMAEAKLA